MDVRADIAIVSATFPPYRGGMGRVAQLDATQLASAGFDVHVLTPGACLSKGAVEEHIERVDDVDGAAYAVHSTQAWLRYGNAALVPSLIRATRDHALTILHYPFFGGAEPVAFGVWLRRCFRRWYTRGSVDSAETTSAQHPIEQLVIVYHMDVVGRGWLRGVFALHRWLILPFVIRQAKFVVVTSMDYARTSAIASFVRRHPERVVVVPPSIDATRFAPGPADPALAARYGLSGNVPTVFFTGGLDRAHYFKGLDYLLRAAARPELAQVRIAIIGSGNLRAGYEALAQQLGIVDRVRFLGDVPDADLPGLLRGATVFAFPSVDRSEAFGIAALEALSCGVPVVASDLPGVRTIVRNGETGFTVPPRDVAALAARLGEVLRDADLRARLSVEARAAVLREYAHEARAKTLLATLSSLLPDRGKTLPNV